MVRTLTKTIATVTARSGVISGGDGSLKIAGSATGGDWAARPDADFGTGTDIVAGSIGSSSVTTLEGDVGGLGSSLRRVGGLFGRDFGFGKG